MRLLLITFIMTLFISGCQKTYEPTNTLDLTDDINKIHSILKDKREIYFEQKEYTLSESELDNISKSIDKISGKLNELNYLKKISKDEDLYTALKILIDLDVMTILSDNDIDIKNISKIIVNMAQQRTKQMISLINAGVDIRQYLKDYKKLDCIGSSCGYINILMYISMVSDAVKQLKLSEEDRKTFKNFTLNIKNAWGLYLFQSDGVDRQIYRSIQKIYLPYLEKKGIYNDAIDNLMEDITKYTTNKSMNFVAESANTALSYVTDSRYVKEFFMDTKNGKVTEEDISMAKEERSETFPLICKHNKFLFEEARTECLDYINKANFESLVEKMADSNIDDGKTYIIIDDEVCMIKDKDKINFYGKNEICRAIEKRSK